MTQRNGSRVLLAVLAVLGGGLLLCAGVCGGWVYYRLLSHMHTYEAAAVPTIGAATVAVDVRPGTRLSNPDRLVGPPYEVMFNVQDPSSQATAAILHSVRLENGSEILQGVVGDPQRDARTGPSGTFVLLYGNFQGTAWSSHPTLVADIEIISGTLGSVRQEVEFPLRTKHTADVYIP